MRSKATKRPPGAVGVIYALRDVRHDDCRYVGLTTLSPQERLWSHWSCARAGKPQAVYKWMAKRLHDQQLVALEVLEVVMTNKSDLGAAEKRWIERLRAEGHRLLNLTDGGEGMAGTRWTDERRRLMREKRRGFKHSEETKARLSAQRKGTRTGADNPNYGRFGPDHPAYGTVRSEETRRLLSEQRRGALNPNYGKSPSAETRAKQSAATKGVPMPSSVRSAHTRHHTNKGLFKETCRHCVDDAESSAGERN